MGRLPRRDIIPELVATSFRP